MNCPYCKKEFHMYDVEPSPLTTDSGYNMGEVITLSCPHCKTFLAVVSPPAKKSMQLHRE